MYSTEFGSYPKSYYETAIRQGRILVSDKKVSTSYIVKGGDVLSHTVHRHEPGVAVQSNVEPYVKIINGKCDDKRKVASFSSRELKTFLDHSSLNI